MKDEKLSFKIRFHVQRNMKGVVTFPVYENNTKEA